MKEKIRKIEEEKMILELHVADVVDDHKIKMDAMRLKMSVGVKIGGSRVGGPELCV